MNEEIEYAEMLEIPVNTVNVARRRQKNKRGQSLQQSLIDQVNGRVYPEEESFSPPPLEEQGDFTTRLVQDQEPTPASWRQKRRGALRESSKGEHPTPQQESRAGKIAYRIEFACACALCLGIFLTNVFVPGSAINTFFRSVTAPQSQEDTRVFSDFTLGSIVGENSTATVEVSPEGVVSVTAEGCVYTPVDGTVVDVLQSEGKYTVKISHSPTFTSVLEGVDYVYYQIGDSVKHNVPVAFSKGETAVQMTMYEEGELLSCVQLDDENCLTWAEVETTP